MTQEELDALMAGDLDEELAVIEEEKSDTDADAGDVVSTEQSEAEVAQEEEASLSDSMHYSPPPPTEDHKVVNQLDTVTKDSEQKATEIMDKLDEINNFIMDIESDGGAAVETLEKNIDTFTKLQTKFPSISLFGEMVDANREALSKAKSVIEKSQMSADEIMLIMDIMQYQDIHRQKIERVINVMRALSKYMSFLFESKIDDANRVSSATHIEGDIETENVVSADEIEALLESFGRK